jgi:hypothetical protein
MTQYRPAFEDALRLFARVSGEMKAQGLSAPVLVGGAAVEIYSNSAISTGDFDIVTPAQDVFEDILQRHGFIRPSGPGKATRGWVHPDLALGFEVVSSTLLDGMADRERVGLIDFGSDGIVSVVSVEDVIADRMGQYASGTAREMRDQAWRLFHLHAEADLDYMERRIRFESGGDYGVSDLQD